MLGWRQIKDLADALFVLRDAVVLTEKAADEIISLWEKLPVGFNSQECYILLAINRIQPILVALCKKASA